MATLNRQSAWDAMVGILFIMLLLALYGLYGCTTSTSTLGNGKVDAVRRHAASGGRGLAFTARPDTVAPAYAVSTALLAGLPAERVALPAAVDDIISRRTERLNLRSRYIGLFGDLLLLIKAS